MAFLPSSSSGGGAGLLVHSDSGDAGDGVRLDEAGHPGDRGDRGEGAIVGGPALVWMIASSGRLQPAAGDAGAAAGSARPSAAGHEQTAGNRRAAGSTICSSQCERRSAHTNSASSIATSSGARPTLCTSAVSVRVSTRVTSRVGSRAMFGSEQLFRITGTKLSLGCGCGCGCGFGCGF